LKITVYLCIVIQSQALFELRSKILGARKSSNKLGSSLAEAIFDIVGKTTLWVGSGEQIGKESTGSILNLLFFILFFKLLLSIFSGGQLTAATSPAVKPGCSLN
jgi:hypothetical protein